MVKSYGTITITATDLATTYWIQADETAIIRNTDGQVAPTTIAVMPMTKIGNSAPENFKAYFTVQESDDGKRWTTTVAKTTQVSSYTYTYQSKGSKFILFRMTNENGDILDQTTVPILMQGGIATLYNLDVSSFNLNRAVDGSLNPSSVKFSSYSLTGDENGQKKESYAGRFAIYEDLDISNLDLKWVLSQDDIHVLTEDNKWIKAEEQSTKGVAERKYYSTVDEDSHTYVPSSNAKKILCLFYASGATPDGSTKDLLDYQVVVITQNGQNGDDAYTVCLDNEYHSFIGADSKAIPDSITIHAIAYQGATKITPTVSKVTGTGITATPGAAVNGEVPITIAITDKLAEKGSITIPIVVNGQTFNRVFSYAVAYRVDGIGTIENQYYLSTSDSAQSGGSWVTTCPKWQKGKYIWTRSSITWTNGKVTTTMPVLATAINAANETAASAQETADGKNTVYYGTVAPMGGTYKKNDLWFNSGQDNAQYRWDGAKWQKQEFGTDALGNISANKITTGTLDASKVTVNNLSANAIKSGTIDAKSVTIKNLDATNITSGTLSSDRIGAGTITADKLTVGSGHNLYDLGYDDFEQISDDTYLNGHKIISQQIYESKGATSASIDEHEAYVGTRCLKVTNDANTTNGYVNLGSTENDDGAIPVVYGKTYIYSAWMKADKSISAELSMLGASNTYFTMQNGTYFISEDGTSLFSPENNISFSVISTATKTIGDQWTRIWGICIVPNDVDRIAIQIKDKTASSTLWVDAIQIESGTNKQSPSEWHSAGNTVINGGQITTGSVTARQIAAKSITANQILANTITSAEIAAGTIKAVNIASDTITGSKIAGHTITGTNIAAKSITADHIQTNTITSLGAVTAGSFNLGNGKFQVSSDGVLTATSGKIGGYAIGDYTLTGNQVGLSSLSGHGYAFWAGSNDASSAPFRVGHDGSINIGNGNFTVSPQGYLTAKTGTFSGTISGGSMNINDNFKVSSTGYLTATGANISGTVTADHFSAKDGSIGGYSISVNGLTGTGSSGLIQGGNIQGTSITGSILQSPASTAQGVTGYYTVSDMGLGFVGSLIPYGSGDGQFWNRTEHSFLTWDGENWQIDGGTIYTSNNFNTSNLITSSNIGSQSVNYANSAGSASSANSASSAGYASSANYCNYLNYDGQVQFRMALDANGAWHLQARGVKNKHDSGWCTVTRDGSTTTW